MFAQLKPLLKQRVVTITVSDIGNDLLRVNIIPRQTDNDSDENTALTTPLSVTGKSEESTVSWRVGSQCLRILCRRRALTSSRSAPSTPRR